MSKWETELLRRLDAATEVGVALSVIAAVTLLLLAWA